MQQLPNSLVLCIAGLALSLLATGVAPAQVVSPTRPVSSTGGTTGEAAAGGLLPSTCPLVVEIDDLPGVLRALRGARRLFTSGRATDSDAAEVEGDVVAWSPSEALAGALVHALRWPCDQPVRAALAALLVSASDRVVVGWIPLGPDRLEPVLILRRAPAARIPPPTGTVVATVHGHTIIAAEPDALARARAHLAASAGRAAKPAARPAACRVRMQPRVLRDRLRSGSVSAFAALRHFLVDWPERITIEWRAGRETIRVTAPQLAGRLATTDAIPPPPYVGCSIRWAGRIALPEGLEGLADLLERDPLGIGAAVVRAWPASTPGRDLIARHLSGRFQVLLVRGSGSFTPVPVVGLEMSSAKRGVALLDRLLVASGLCDRFRRDPVPYTYVRRLPDDLRRNRMLIRFFRYHGPQRREYGLGASGNWVWLGPMDEVKRVMGSLHAEDRPLVAADANARTDGAFRAGELDIDAFALWEHLDYQHQFITRDSTRRDTTEEQLRQTMGELAGVMRRPVFAVACDGRALVLSREASLVDSLFSFLAARSSRFHTEIERAESALRREVRFELRAIRRAQVTHRRLEEKFAGSLADLTRLGLWRPREKDPDRRRYRLGMRTAGESFVVFARSRDAALAGQRRPVFAMRADGVLLRGPGGRQAVEALLSAGRDHPAWRRVVFE